MCDYINGVYRAEGSNVGGDYIERREGLVATNDSVDSDDERFREDTRSAVTASGGEIEAEEMRLMERAKIESRASELDDRFARMNCRDPIRSQMEEDDFVFDVVGADFFASEEEIVRFNRARDHFDGLRSVEHPSLIVGGNVSRIETAARDGLFTRWDLSVLLDGDVEILDSNMEGMCLIVDVHRSYKNSDRNELARGLGKNKETVFGPAVYCEKLSLSPTIGNPLDGCPSL